MLKYYEDGITMILHDITRYFNEKQRENPTSDSLSLSLSLGVWPHYLPTQSQHHIIHHHRHRIRRGFMSRVFLSILSRISLSLLYLSLVSYALFISSHIRIYNKCDVIVIYMCMVCMRRCIEIDRRFSQFVILNLELYYYYLLENFSRSLNWYLKQQTNNAVFASLYIVSIESSSLSSYRRCLAKSI